MKRNQYVPRNLPPPETPTLLRPPALSRRTTLASHHETFLAREINPWSEQPLVKASRFPQSIPQANGEREKEKSRRILRSAVVVVFVNGIGGGLFFFFFS